jgi:putative nucleotidyltransferase with HDIG domain
MVQLLEVRCLPFAYTGIMASTKRISIDQLKPGMFVVAMDQPWYRTPFLFHKRLIADQDDILQMRRAGIQEVTIDTDQGIDIPAAAAAGHDARPTEEPAGSSEAGSTDEPTATAPDAQKIMAEARTTYREATAAMERIFAELDAGHAPNLVSVRSVVARVVDQILLHQESMLMQFCLQKMRRFDRSLASHGIDVCVLSLIVANEQGLQESDRELLGMGAMLHDIGYTRLPRNLYRKSGILLPQEKALMQQHPQLGLTVMAESADVPELVRHIIAEHHEHFNGSGYPNKLTGASLSPLVQIVGLVDTYDGMVTSRNGKPALLPHDAIRQLFVLGEKGRFDKAVVEVAIKALGVYPIGSLIKLNTGESALVTGLNHEHRLKPKIRIITDAKGQIFSESIGLDLSAECGSQPARTILRALDPKTEQVNVAAYLEPASGQ